MSPTASNASADHVRMGLPAISTSCLPPSLPKRSPVPPAKMTAAVCGFSSTLPSKAGTSTARARRCRQRSSAASGRALSTSGEIHRVNRSSACRPPLSSFDKHDYDRAGPVESARARTIFGIDRRKGARPCDRAAPCARDRHWASYALAASASLPPTGRPTEPLSRPRRPKRRRRPRVTPACARSKFVSRSSASRAMVSCLRGAGIDPVPAVNARFSPSIGNIGFNDRARRPLAFKQLFGQRVFQEALDSTAQRTGAVRGVGAFLGDELVRGVGKVDGHVHGRSNARAGRPP